MNTSRGNYIKGQWIQGQGSNFTSLDPSNGKIVWEGNSSTQHDVNTAVEAARQAFSSWKRLSIEERISHLERFGTALTNSDEELAHAISMDVGKPLWEAKTEVASMLGKIKISIDAYRQRCAVVVKEQPKKVSSVTRHKPHGVMAVLGPYNFPGHLPNGHIIPALLAGNTVVFKPSELAPSVAEVTFRLWEQAALPEGVINLIQGGADTGRFLSEHPDINGLLFTGSAATGKKLAEHFAKHPEKIVALEMGGNNPLVVGKISDPEQAAEITIQSAYLTSGQRCTCARRLIVVESEQSHLFINALIAKIKQITVGPYNKNPEPYMGPVISEAAAKHLLLAVDQLISHQGVPLVEMRYLQAGTGLLSPGLIEMTQAVHRPDTEIFGPVLQLIRVPSFEAAITEANHTVYGLSAGLISSDPEEYAHFYQEVNAGIINWNTPLTGASSGAPFGGIGHSGNHRPSAYYATDYCTYPVASLESPEPPASPSGP